MELDQEGPQLEPGQTATEIASDSRSVLDKITQRRDERDDTEVFDIPSWDGDLKARYQVVDRADMEKMILRARRRARGNGSSSGVDADADFLIKACCGVIAYDVDTDAEEQIASGYTMDLASMFKPVWPKGHPQEGESFTIHNERELVVYLLKWNGVALATHGAKVARWMQDTSKSIEDPQ